MAMTPSNMIPLGTQAPDFNLPDTISGKTYKLHDLKGSKATVIMFICNHCPFVIHINKAIVNIANTFQNKEVQFIAISSNDAGNYPQDGPEQMAMHAKIEKYPFPYLYDATQNIAKAYDAACTPDFYVFNNDLKLTYRGQLDNSRPGNNIEVTGTDLIHAINCTVKNTINNNIQKPSIGCNIKWIK